MYTKVFYAKKTVDFFAMTCFSGQEFNLKRCKSSAKERKRVKARGSLSKGFNFLSILSYENLEASLVFIKFEFTLVMKMKVMNKII